jgi:hypothetical protein
MHAGSPFAKKGDSELSLPKMDIPISFMKWEVFLPEKYKVKDFLGDAVATSLLPPSLPMPILISGSSPSSTVARSVEGGRTISHQVAGDGPNFAQTIDQEYMRNLPNLGSNVVDLVGMLGGVVTAPNTNLDQSNMMIMGTPASGTQLIRDGININDVRWNTGVQTPSHINQEKGRGAESATLKPTKGNTPIVSNEASANIYNLQRRVAGVLPIRVDVPRAGASYSFIRPLVLDEETKVTFRYKSK